MSLNQTFERVQIAFSENFTRAGLKAIIILWALFIIVLALIVDNSWLLAGILAYEVLP